MLNRLPSRLLHARSLLHRLGAPRWRGYPMHASAFSTVSQAGGLKLSHVEGTRDIPLITDTIGDYFSEQVSLHGDRVALVSCHQGVRMSYSDLLREVDAMCHGLMSIGLKKGDRLGVWMPNNAEWLTLQLATAKAGIILANINPSYRLEELVPALNKIECKAIVTVPQLKSSNYLNMLCDVAPGVTGASPGEWVSELVPSLESIIVVRGGSDEDVTGVDPLAGGTLPQGMIMYDDLLSHAAGAFTPPTSVSSDDIINIQFTSGTTGTPKGASLTHRGILNNGFFVGEGLQLTPEDRLCIPVPLYHCFGMVLGNLACLTHGSAIVYPAASFDPLSTLRAVHNERCTGLHGVPTMFISELNHPEFSQFDLSSLRTGIMAGSPCPIQTMREVMETMNMSQITICYGQTETSPVSFQSSTTDPIEYRTSTVGRVHPWVEARIVDPEGGEKPETMPVGQEGELYTRGYMVMAEYWADPVRTKQAISEEGWMRTGDLAVMDERGYVKITGRSKDLIIRGGENISPVEIEDHLFTHPDVENVSVIGVPDEVYGEVVCAAVIPRPGSPNDPEAVRDHMRGRVSHFKVPQHVLFMDEFPTTITGKIQKYKLRDIAKDILSNRAN